MAGAAPPAASLHVAGSSDWQCAKQELMKSPLLLEPAKSFTDATIWSLKSCRNFIWDASQAEWLDLQARQAPLGSAPLGARLSCICQASYAAFSRKMGVLMPSITFWGKKHCFAIAMHERERVVQFHSVNTYN